MYVINREDMTRYARERWELSPEVDVILRSVIDEHSHPTDFGCYTDDQIQDFNSGSWGYVGLIATVYGPHGIELGEAAVWGFEAGDFRTENGCTLYVDPLYDEDSYRDIIAEAIKNAQENLGLLSNIRIG